MIKKVFVGVLLAGVFGLLILGAVNRTIAKSVDNEPLALSEGNDGGNGNEGGNRGGNQVSSLHEQLSKNENAGNGSGSGNGNVQPPLDGSGFGKGRDNVSGGLGGGGRAESTPDDGLSLGLADAGVWEDPITVTLDSVTTDLWIVSNNEGFDLGIEGRALRFIVDSGFQAEVGDDLVLEGFYEGDKFEVGMITNNSTQQALTIREASGRPMWAGRGQGSRTP